MGYSDKVKEIADGSEIQIYGTTFDSGEWKNEAKEAHHLTIVGATTETADPPGDDLDSYLDFDGVDDVAHTAHDSELDGFGAKNVSFGLFINTKNQNSFWDVIFGKGSGGYEFRFHDTDNSTIRFNPDAANGGLLGISHGFHNEWVFYVFTWNQSTLSAYRRTDQHSSMQFISSTSLQASDWVSNSNPFKVGARGTVGDFSRNARIQVAGLFSVGQVLTTQEMDSIYEAKDAPPVRPEPEDIGTENVDQYEIAEFSKAYDGYSGNPFDIIVTVIATHTSTSEERSFEMFYDGDWNWRTGQKGSVDLFKIRFSNGIIGEWTFETFSSVTALDNLRGTINIAEQTNPVLARGPIQAGDNKKWIEKETGKVLVPAFVINGRGLAYYWDDVLGEPEAQVMDNDIALFVTDHKLTGLEMEPTFSMFDPTIDELDGASGITDVDSPDLSPSIDSFRIIEMLIEKAYEAGGYIHLWQFGGGIDHNEDEMSGGYNGSVHNRINRYYAARLGAHAGWNMSAGWDVWDSRRTNADVNKFNAWVIYMQERLLLGQMVGGRWHRNNQDIANWDQNHNADWVGSEDHELLNWNGNIAYNRFVEWLNAINRPLFNEDRERRGYVTPWPSREYEFPRGARVNWHTYMAGGIAQIIAQFDPSKTDFSSGQSQKAGRDDIVLRSYAFDEFDPVEKQTLVIWRTFIEEYPLTTEAIRNNNLTNQFGLFIPTGVDQGTIIAYREVATSVDIDLTSASSITKAVAVNAHGTSYSEIDILSELTAGQSNTWTAPSESDWVLAIEGEFEEVLAPTKQFFNDFSQYPTGQFPNDWTKIWNPESADITVEEVAGATGGKVLRITGGVGTSNRHALIWDVIDEFVDGRAEAEVLVRARVNDFSVVNSGNIMVGARLSGDSNTRTGYTARVRSVSSNQADSGEFLNGAFNSSTIGNVAPATWTSATWFFFGIKLNAASNPNIRVRQWVDGDTEREWNAQNTDDFEVADGGVGVGGIAHDIVEIDWIGVGVDGEEAPREAVSVPSNEFTGKVSGAGSISGIWQRPALETPELMGAISGGGILSGVLEVPSVSISEITGLVTGAGQLSGSLEQPEIPASELIGLISGGGLLQGILEPPQIDNNELTGSVSGAGKIEGLMEIPDVGINEVVGSVSGGGKIEGSLMSSVLLSTNFSEYETGLQPPGWSTIWGTHQNIWQVSEDPSIHGSKVLKSGGSGGAGLRAIAWDDAGVYGDSESLSLIKVDGSASTQQILIGLRMNSNNNGYLIFLDVFQHRVSIRRVVNGTATNIGSFITGGWSILEWYWLRFSIIGNLIRFKIWKKDDPEPLNWSAEGTDSTFADGKAGVGFFVVDPVKYIDYFAVSNGDTIPVPEIVPVHDLTGVVSGGGSISGSLEEIPIEDNEVIGSVSGGGSIIGAIELPLIDMVEFEGKITGGGSINGIFHFQSLLPNLKNHIVMVESEFKLTSEFISPKNIPKTEVFTITEGSTGIILLKFFNKDGEPVAPTSVYYKIDCDTHEVRPLTQMEEPEEEVLIELTGSDNGIYKDKGIEQHVVTIKIFHDGDRRMNIEKVYNVYPLKFLQEIE